MKRLLFNLTLGMLLCLVAVGSGRAQSLQVNPIQPEFFVPPHTTGDYDFWHGPESHVEVKLWVVTPDRLQIKGRISMVAKETFYDWTTAEGSHEFVAYTHDKPIEAIRSSTFGAYSYTDDDTRDDLFTFPSDNLFGSLRFVGKRDDMTDEAGRVTGVQVVLNPIIIGPVVQSKPCPKGQRLCPGGCWPTSKECPLEQ